MSKMDQETIYEIYRACRLCGAGAGYKMPIIQNVVDVDDTDLELKEKIRECVQIEVHQDDKMPPLICELCVDKVNDFYEFLDMCRQTNKKTRLRLGLPPQAITKGATDAAECILGVTEPVYVNDDSDEGEPLSKHKKNKAKVKREPELRVKLENKPLTIKSSGKPLPDSRSMRFKKKERTPPRTTRSKYNIKEDRPDSPPLEKTLRSSLKSQPSPKTTPKPILKKEQMSKKEEKDSEDISLSTLRLKRSRDKEPVKLETPNKRVKLSTKPLTSTPKSSSTSSSPKSSPKVTPKPSKPPPKPAPKRPVSPKPAPKRQPSPPPVNKCRICEVTFKNVQGLSTHLKSHTVTYTSLRMACNPCGLWFPTSEEASSHHRSHRSKYNPYSCTRCITDFVHLTAYDEHLSNKQCISLYEVPDVKCDDCWRLFATNNLLDNHKCGGPDNRPGGKCGKCHKSYALLKNLKKHESTCTVKKRGDIKVDPEIKARLRPIQVRVARCDPLLKNIKKEHVDVSNVMPDFGYDKNCFYPYISSISSLRIKTEFDGMVSIQDEVKEEFCSAEYIHWDSDTESESDSEDLTSSGKKKTVDSLSTLTLKTLFSPKALGRVPRKRRRMKTEKSFFDSMFNDEQDDVTRDVNNIINNLGNDDDDFDDDGKASQTGSDSILRDDSEKHDFDSLKDISLVEESDNHDVSCTNNDDNSEAGNKNDDENEVASEIGGKNDEKYAAAVKNDAASEKNDDGAKNNDEIDGGGDKNDVPSEVCSKNDRKKKYEINNATEQNFQNDHKTDEKCEEIDKNDQSVLQNENSNGVCEETDLEIKEKTVTNDISSYSSVNTDNLGVKAVKNGSILSEICNKTDISDNYSSNLNSKVNHNDDNDDNSLKNDENSSKNDELSQDSNSTGTLHESLLNENTQRTINGENDDERKITPESMDVSNQDSKDSKTINNRENKEKEFKSSTEFDMDDDSKLMAALDAEIGENDSSQIKNVSDEKIALEDLISSKSHDRMDIDIIPDEFNFDN